MEDSKIIALFFERSQKAIEKTDEKYGRLSMRTAKNILGSTEDARECVNDAYLALWNKIPPESPSPLGAYIVKTVRNCALKKYHSNIAKKRNSFYDVALSELEGVLTSADSPENELQFRELSAAINSFLEGCDRENRIFFVRRYFFGDSVKDIALATGNSPHFVSVRLSRMREKLKDYLKEEGLI